MHPCGVHRAGANTGRSRVTRPSFPSLGLGHCQLRVSLGGSSLTGALREGPPRCKGHSGRGEGFLSLCQEGEAA